MKRMALVLAVFLIVVGLAATGTEALGQKAQAAKGKGGGGGNGGGGGGTDPNYVLRLTINDGFEHPDLIDPMKMVKTRLLSDGQYRIVADDDEDDFLELIGDPDFFVDYQDYRLPVVTSDTYPDTYPDTHPDPCVELGLSTDASPGRTRLQLSRRSSNEFSPNIRCDLSPPYADDDERTFTLVFDKNEGKGSADGDVGGACACDKLSYVSGVAGAQTTFMDDYPATGFCALAIAPGEIAPGGENSGPRIEAWPFEDLLTSKKAQKRSGQSPDGYTTVRINFRTDVADLEDDNGWWLLSQGEDIHIKVLSDDVRRVTSEGQLFDLSGRGQCSNVSMSFQFTVERFDLNKVH